MFPAQSAPLRHAVGPCSGRSLVRGASWIVFGLSHNYLLSLWHADIDRGFRQYQRGWCDTSLIQMLTPDAMARSRVGRAVRFSSDHPLSATRSFVHHICLLPPARSSGEEWNMLWSSCPFWFSQIRKLGSLTDNQTCRTGSQVQRTLLTLHPTNKDCCFSP